MKPTMKYLIEQKLSSKYINIKRKKKLKKINNEKVFRELYEMLIILFINKVV